MCVQGARGPAPARLLKPTQPLIPRGLLRSRVGTRERKAPLDREGVVGTAEAFPEPWGGSTGGGCPELPIKTHFCALEPGAVV